MLASPYIDPKQPVSAEIAEMIKTIKPLICMIKTTTVLHYSFTSFHAECEDLVSMVTLHMKNRNKDRKVQFSLV